MSRTHLGDYIYAGQVVSGTQQLTSAGTVTITPSNAYVGLQSTTGQLANLPQGTTCIVGIEKTVDDLGGNSGTNAHTIAAFSGDTIQGATTLTLNQDNGTIRVRLVNATTWRVIG